MGNRIKTFAAAALVLIWASADPATIASQEVWQTDEIVLVFERRMRSLAEEVHRQYPSVKQELEQVFGWTLKVAPKVILIHNQVDFQRLVPNPLFVAVALPSRNTIVIDTSRVQADSHSLRITLAHELAHLLLHQHIGGARLPRWLDEGVCQWYTGGVAEVLLDRYRPMLGKALGSGEHIALSEITKRFPSEPQRLMLAYEQSRDIVTFVANRYGSEKLMGILNRLHHGDSVESSIHAQLGITLEELERLWLRKLSGGVIWWARVASNLYGLLFFLAALLTVAGFAVRTIRRKKKYDAEQEENTVE